MTHVVTTRIWCVQPGHRETFLALMEQVQRIVTQIPGADLCLCQDQADPHRFVTFGEWPDRAAMQAFRAHPDLERLQVAIVAIQAATYPPEEAIELREVLV